MRLSISKEMKIILALILFYYNIPTLQECRKAENNYLSAMYSHYNITERVYTWTLRQERADLVRCYRFWTAACFYRDPNESFYSRIWWGLNMLCHLRVTPDHFVE